MELIKLFNKNSNLNSKYQIGTEKLSFPRNSHNPWIYSPPYVRFGPGRYDPVNEFRNPALFGDISPQSAKDFKFFLATIPVSMVLFSFGMIDGLRKGSTLKGFLQGGVAGAIPMGLGLYKLKNSLK